MHPKDAEGMENSVLPGLSVDMFRIIVVVIFGRHILDWYGFTSANTTFHTCMSLDIGFFKQL